MSRTKGGSTGGNYRACPDGVFLVSEKWDLLCDCSQFLPKSPRFSQVSFMWHHKAHIQTITSNGPFIYSTTVIINAETKKEKQCSLCTFWAVSWCFILFGSDVINCKASSWLPAQNSELIYLEGALIIITTISQSYYAGSVKLTALDQWKQVLDCCIKSNTPKSFPIKLMSGHQICTSNQD